MRVGSDQYWRCMEGMNRLAEEMRAQGYGEPENIDRLWCGVCMKFPPATLVRKIDDQAVCAGCETDVFTPREIQAYRDKEEK